jgi:hypothetical protein
MFCFKELIKETGEHKKKEIARICRDFFFVSDTKALKITQKIKKTLVFVQK